MFEDSLSVLDFLIKQKKMRHVLYSSTLPCQRMQRHKRGGNPLSRAKMAIRKGLKRPQLQTLLSKEAELCFE
jgi:hypothetical protein